MTKAELIKKLEKYPDNMIVVVDGHEDGYDDPLIRQVKIDFKSNDDNGEKFADYYGRHGRVNDGVRNKKTENSINSILISRHE